LVLHAHRIPLARRLAESSTDLVLDVDDELGVLVAADLLGQIQQPPRMGLEAATGGQPQVLDVAVMVGAALAGRLSGQLDALGDEHLQKRDGTQI